MITRDALRKFPFELANLGGHLLKSREQLLKEPYLSATAIVEKMGLNVETVVDYWETIDYRLEDEHLQGLRLFFQLCKKYHLLEDEPELNFLV